MFGRDLVRRQAAREQLQRLALLHRIDGLANGVFRLN
jgi:hypothetical protein